MTEMGSNGIRMPRVLITTHGLCLQWWCGEDIQAHCILLTHSISLTKLHGWRLQIEDLCARAFNSDKISKVQIKQLFCESLQQLNDILA